MAAHVFEDLGYRRYEWKCDALNAASRCRRVAPRVSAHEGTFRNAVVYKGRNRDTAWFSITDCGVGEPGAAHTAAGSTRRTSTPTADSALSLRTGYLALGPDVQLLRPFVPHPGTR